MWVGPSVDLPGFTQPPTKEVLDCTHSKAHNFKEEGGGGGAIQIGV